MYYFNYYLEDFYYKKFTESLTSREVRLINIIVYQLDFKVNFQPFNGKFVSEIIETDPEKFLDLIINLDHFCVRESVLLNKKIMLCHNFNSALLKNKIKLLFKQKLNKLDYELRTDNNPVPDKNDDSSDYSNESQKSYSKYGRYNGYDDDTIDSAYEGDPSNTWNND